MWVRHLFERRVPLTFATLRSRLAPSAVPLCSFSYVSVTSRSVIDHFLVRWRPMSSYVNVVVFRPSVIVKS